MTKKKDILGDLLTGAAQGSFSGLEELNGLFAQPVPLTSRRKVSRNDYREKRTLKKKASHYLSPATFEGITRTLPEICKIIPEKERKRFSRSRLVDASMQLLLRDFEEKGKDSLLVRYLMENRNT